MVAFFHPADELWELIL